VQNPDVPTPTGDEGQPPTGGRRIREWEPATPQAAQAVSAGLDAAYRKSGITAAMLTAQKQVHERLHGLQALAMGAQAAARGLSGPENIVGTYLGEKWEGGRPTGKLGVVVMVRTKQADEAKVAPAFLVGQSEAVGSESVPLDVRVVGDPVPHEGFQSREVPAAYGASIGLAAVGATGTLGCLVRTNDDRLCILSNNHVLADVNKAQPGAAVVQPGNADNAGAQGVIANLVKFVPLNLSNVGPSAPNRVDGALAWTRYEYCVPRLHNTEVVFNASTRLPTLNMVVMKEGRTTGYTKGIVIGLNASVTIGYGLSRPGSPPTPPYGSFTGQIVLQGLFGDDFSQAGDSGSLVLGLDGEAYHPIGLLFAGGQPQTGPAITWANPIDEVLAALEVAEILDHQVD
jgi:hypothetical protein